MYFTRKAIGEISHLLQRLQRLGVDLGDVVGLCDGVEVLADRIHVHHAVIGHFDASEVREESEGEARLRSCVIIPLCYYTARTQRWY